MSEHAVSESPSADNASFGRFAELLLGSATVVGGAIYAGLWVALWHIYRPFGVMPDEVGWDFAGTLTRFSFVIFYAAFTFSSCVAILLLFGRSLKRGRWWLLEHWY
jgi:hypothetical protein